MISVHNYLKVLPLGAIKVAVLRWLPPILSFAKPGMMVWIFWGIAAQRILHNLLLAPGSSPQGPNPVSKKVALDDALILDVPE
jgi:hypothetical protein